MNIRQEIYIEAVALLEKVNTNRPEGRGGARERFINASQKSLEDFVAYNRTFVLTIEEVEEVHAAKALADD